MAKNKILRWMGALQGIKDIGTIALQSLGKTSMDAIKALAAEKSILVRTIPAQPKEVQSYAKDVGLEVIRNLKLTDPVSPKKNEGQLKSEWTNGIFAEALVRKPVSKK